MSDRKIEVQHKGTPDSVMTVCHDHTETLKNKNKVRVIRFLDGGYGLDFWKREGHASVRTTLGLSEEAMLGLIKGYEAIKDKPLAFTWQVVVTEKKPQAKKKAANKGTKRTQTQAPNK